MGLQGAFSESLATSGLPCRTERFEGILGLGRVLPLQLGDGCPTGSTFGSMGLVVPSTAVLALENYGPTAGTAAALMGTLQLITGAAVVGVVGAFSNGTVLPMVAAIVVCATAAFILGRFTLGAGQAVPAPAE